MFKEALTQYPNNATYVDLFGGSGLLSHTVKTQYPQATVVYNDYDNFSQRLNNIARTNQILEQLRGITQGTSRETRLPETIKQQVVTCFEHAEQHGFVDWLTLGSNLAFSGKAITNLAQLKTSTLYNNVRKSNYAAPVGYLKGVTLASEDYQQLFNRYQSMPNVVFILDPPYLSTDCSRYKNAYWRLRDHLNILSTLRNQRFIYFTSDKSQILDVVDWLSSHCNEHNPFVGTKVVTTHNTINKNASYQDMMFYK